MKQLYKSSVTFFPFVIFLAVLSFWNSCKEEDRLDHIDETAPAPAQVSDISVRNIAGGAVIKYNIPDDPNLLGVKAVYERTTGELAQTKASLYVDSLVIEGMGDTNMREVKLYSEGRNGKNSDPLPVEINPLTPAIEVAAVTMEPAFGGVAVKFTNDARTNLALVLMQDTVGNELWSPLQIFYTAAPSGVFYFRGMDAVETKFGIYMRDRWNNKSDTLIELLTPVKEELIPKTDFKNLPLPGDSWEYIQGSQYRVEGAWDGVTSNRTGNVFANRNTEPMPQHFTIDLGMEASISRFKLHHRVNDQYSGTSPRTFELWGSMNPPSDGSFDNWFLLGSFEAFKPSGYQPDGSVGTITQEDKNYANIDGIDCELQVTDEIADPYRTVRYLRFRTTSTYQSYGTDVTQGQVIIAELTFWGQIK